MNATFRKNLWLALGLIALQAPLAQPGEPAPPRTPDEFAIVFIAGYAADHLPQDPAQFEAVVKACKEAHYNVILAKYTDQRAEICRKHGVKLMVDMLVDDHHVYRNPEGARALAERLRDSDVVYAYHLWSDRVGGTVAGRNRDIANMRQWDPNHPTYVGDYRAAAIGRLEQPDLIGFYDFHWSRGGLYPHLNRAMAAAKRHNVPLLKYLDPTPGQPGGGNYNRVLFTVSQSAVFGLRGYMPHYRGNAHLNLDTAEWGVVGEDLKRVNAYMAPLGPELMKLGNPLAVYSTPCTRDARDRPIDPPAVPPGLHAVPDDFWAAISKGEVLVGEYRYPADDGAKALLLANHNAYQPQAVEFTLAAGAGSRVWLFDRAAGRWAELDRTEDAWRLAIPPAGLELVRVQ